MPPHVDPSLSILAMPIAELAEVESPELAQDAWVILMHDGKMERLSMTTLAKMVKELNKGPKV